MRGQAAGFHFELWHLSGVNYMFIGCVLFLYCIHNWQEMGLKCMSCRLQVCGDRILNVAVY